MLGSKNKSVDNKLCSLFSASLEDGFLLLLNGAWLVICLFLFQILWKRFQLILLHLWNFAHKYMGFRNHEQKSISLIRIGFVEVVDKTFARFEIYSAMAAGTVQTRHRISSKRQVKEQGRFLVSRCLTLPPAPLWAVGVLDDYFYPKK